jgi:phosphatidylinositol glycan class B
MGIAGAVLLGVIADRWFYDEWVFTPWHYLDLNIIQDKVSNFGLSPWYQYFVDLLTYGIPPFSLILLLFSLLYPILFPKSPVAWAVLPFVLLHVAVGHKEARFLFPAVAFLPWMVVAVAANLPQRLAWTAWFVKPFLVRLFWVLNGMALAIVVFKPAEANMGLYKYLYRNYAGSSTLMLGLNDIPYEHENLQVRFFRDSQWVRQRLDQDSLFQPEGYENVLVIVNHALPYDSLKFTSLVDEESSISPLYQDIPGWLALFDYKGWYSRSDKWHVYRYDGKQLSEQE